ncbi:MAG: HAMP domain-containing histidine kinase [Nocardioidaceae bacterium]|nr:HAMP domain-containing histidine kinase [Nocardioidaceae bacterium]MCL2612552.1 HAMP domain-containing histidine kinase [Nocardioidaceae bacterium]
MGTPWPMALGHGSDGRWHYRRSLASRVIVLTTMAVGLAVALVAAGAYLTARVQMQNDLDRSLIQRAQYAANLDQLLGTQSGLSPWQVGAADVRIAFLLSDGSEIVVDNGPTIPIGGADLAVAQGKRRQALSTVLIADQRYRMVTVPTSERDGMAVILAEPLATQDHVLSRLGWVSLAFGLVGVLGAAFAGWLVATNGLRPVRRLTSAVERVARTEDFTPLQVEGDDEVARLSTAFNHMLTALDASRVRQRQLVADAGHELRTPLTALRTNIDLLTMVAADPSALPVDARDELLDDVRAQIEELTTLIGDLTELAREEPVQAQVEPLDLADVIDHAVQRVRRRAPSLTFELFTRTWWVEGEAAELERAVTNLLDNAAKWSPEGGKVTVRLSDGVLTVDDQGPGIAEEDRGRVFDRFWRSADARTMPGSGLGLSIVRQVAERHGGSVMATANSTGGARLVLRLPGRELVDA